MVDRRMEEMAMATTVRQAEKLTAQDLLCRRMGRDGGERPTVAAAAAEEGLQVVEEDLRDLARVGPVRRDCPLERTLNFMKKSGRPTLATILAIKINQ